MGGIIATDSGGNVCWVGATDSGGFFSNMSLMLYGCGAGVEALFEYLIAHMHVRHSQSEKENVIYMCCLLTHT